MEKEQTGNLHAVFVARVMCTCNRYHVDYSVEQPQTSLMWLLPSIKKATLHCRSVTFYMCGYGCPYQKPTTFKGPNDWILSLSNECRHTVHEVMLGGSGNRAKKAKEAAAYPIRLATKYAELAQKWHGSSRGGGSSWIGRPAINPGRRRESTVDDSIRDVPAPVVPAAKDSEATAKAARECVRHVGEAPPEWSAEAVAALVKVNRVLLQAAGSMSSAVQAYREAFVERHGNHLSSERIDQVAHLLHGDVAKRLREVATGGVRTGYQGPRTRRPGMMYKGAQEYIQEAMKQVWKEIKEGRVFLLRDDDSPEMQSVVSSPWSRVPKQNTDRTMSDEGRFCHDLRDPVNEHTPGDSLPNVVLNTHREVCGHQVRCPVLGDTEENSQEGCQVGLQALVGAPGRGGNHGYGPPRPCGGLC